MANELAQTQQVNVEELYTKALSAGKDLENFYKEHTGKDGHNPFIYLSETVWPLVATVSNDKLTKEVRIGAARELLKLEKDVKKIQVDVVATPQPKPGDRIPVKTIEQTLVK